MKRQTRRYPSPNRVRGSSYSHTNHTVWFTSTSEEVNKLTRSQTPRTCHVVPLLAMLFKESRGRFSRAASTLPLAVSPGSAPPQDNCLQMLQCREQDPVRVRPREPTEASRRGECKMIISSCECIYFFPVILIVDAKLSP